MMHKKRRKGHREAVEGPVREPKEREHPAILACEGGGNGSLPVGGGNGVRQGGLKSWRESVLGPQTRD